MAKVTHLSYVIGTDHQFIFEVLNDDEDAAIDCAGFALSFMVKREKEDRDAVALITKTSGIAVSGTFNADPDVNTQVATVTVLDTDTDHIEEGRAFWELKRTDAGYETQLGSGTFTFVRGVHHA